MGYLLHRRPLAGVIWSNLRGRVTENPTGVIPELLRGASKILRRVAYSATYSSQVIDNQRFRAWAFSRQIYSDLTKTLHYTARRLSATKSDFWVLEAPKPAVSNGAKEGAAELIFGRGVNE